MSPKMSIHQEKAQRQKRKSTADGQGEESPMKKRKAGVLEHRQPFQLAPSPELSGDDSDFNFSIVEVLTHWTPKCGEIIKRASKGIARANAINRKSDILLHPESTPIARKVLKLQGAISERINEQNMLLQDIDKEDPWIRESLRKKLRPFEAEIQKLRDKLSPSCSLDTSATKNKGGV